MLVSILAKYLVLVYIAVFVVLMLQAISIAIFTKKKGLQKRFGWAISWPVMLFSEQGRKKLFNYST